MSVSFTSNIEPPRYIFLVFVAFLCFGIGEGVNNTEVRATPKWTMPMWLESVPLVWDGSVFATKALYISELYIGSPGKRFTLIIDTGSGNTVVPSVGCHSLSCRNKQLYNRDDSLSSKKVRIDNSLASFSTGKIYIKYGDGDLSGTFIRDQVCLDPNATECIALDMVESHTMAKNPFALFSFDGVLGLGLPTLSANEEFNFATQVMRQHPGMLTQVSISLGCEGCANSITIGGYDEDLSVDPPTWVPVVNPELGYWLVGVKSVSIAGERADYCNDGECKAVADLGSTLFNVPTGIWKKVQLALVKPVPDSVTDPNFDCVGFCADHTLHFELYGVDITLPAVELMHEKPFMHKMKNGTRRLLCGPNPRFHHVGLPPPLGPKAFILGHPVLRTYHTTYDWKEKRVGFALADKTRKEVKVEGAHKRAHPAYIRALNSTDYYLPHLSEKEEEMENIIAASRGKGLFEVV